MKSLTQLTFDNRFARLGDTFSTEVSPQPLSDPRLVVVSEAAMALLDMDPAEAEQPLFAELFSGHKIWSTVEPRAMVYSGHQFGSYNPQLGDGRGLLLGEVVNEAGEYWDLHLKGAGKTPYSRMGDGRAVLRSSIREFLASEHLHALGIPSSRALCVTGSDSLVYRERPERGAMLLRLAPSHVRFGHFEFFYYTRQHAELKQLLEHVIEAHFTELLEHPEPFHAFFREVLERTAALIARWQAYGFCHGVMNTDNMSILGLTIDYGPYGWIDDYNPDWTPNTTDIPGGRYRYCNQPQIALWNLAQLANALLPLVGQTEPFEEGLQMYSASYQQQWRMMMAQKLGLQRFEPGTDLALTNELDRMLRLTETDMTIFFRCLADLDSSNDQTDEQLLTPLLDAYYQPEELTVQVRRQICSWLRSYLQRIADDGRDPAARQRTMNAVNPKYVLRNYLAQMAIDRAEAGDFSLVNQLLEVMRQPYTDQPHHQQFAYKRPEWARHRPGCSTLSCSS